MPKTFAEKLKEHIKYCNELGDQAQKLMTQSKESGNIKKSKQLLSEAGKLLKSIRVAFRKFDMDYKNELKTLISYVDARRK